jgi:hypothetical protein
LSLGLTAGPFPADFPVEFVAVRKAPFRKAWPKRVGSGIGKKVRIMFEPLRVLAAVALAGTAWLAVPAAGQPPEREVRIIVYGDEPCPVAEDPEEIVVCARQPDEERYRIPEPLRRGEELSERSWSNQVAELEDAQRDSRPNSCSVVGSFGQTGCTQQMLRQWHDERRNRRPEP